MAEDADRNALRKDVGATLDELPNTEADALIEEGATKYPSNADAALYYPRVRYLEQAWAKSINEDVDYTQNEESEDLGDRPKNKKSLLDFWRDKLDAAVAVAELPKGRRPAFFGLAKAGRRWYP